MFAQFEIDLLKQKFAAQNEFLVVENLLGPETLQPLLARLPQLRPSVHRNYLPKHKKGCSVSRFVLDRMAPAFESLYTLPEFTLYHRTIAFTLSRGRSSHLRLILLHGTRRPCRMALRHVLLSGVALYLSLIHI